MNSIHSRRHRESDRKMTPIHKFYSMLKFNQSTRSLPEITIKDGDDVDETDEYFGVKLRHPPSPSMKPNLTPQLSLPEETALYV